MREVLPFILCGGSGTRLWPLSREAYPKQFHRITGPESLFQQTCCRLTGDLFGDLSVLSNHRHRFLIAEQLEEIGVSAANIVLEPVGRNTAPAACIAALIAASSDPNALVLLAPSDHVIGDAGAFAKAVANGIDAAREGALVTFGVEPDCPHTGYGYIETDKAEGAALPVRRFVEKPSREAAEAYLNSGRFYWNAGIFLFRAGTLLGLLQIHAPDILEACRRALDEAVKDLGFLALGQSYTQAPAISLDYAVAEKADKLVCVPLNTPWSDVGSWSEIWNFMEKDEVGNAVQGEGKIILENSSNSLAYSDRMCVALVGVDNLVVVAMGDAVLVASKDHAEAIKTLVNNLKGNGQDIALQHNRVHRPWGWYQGLNRGERYQVKCIMVKPGGRLSLQSHHHRSEHWVVVKGTLEVTKGEETSFLTENQSTYIAIGEKHRLANPGKIPAYLIEVQSGSYLDEDDIVRFEDIYRRSSSE
ncbi:MAG: mannose-1-phosphate guanylyltransferase/mannose-6-phosphate isomerase [Methyloceanibacter sp.]|jgi:mannose-1-phosphate guanylyltransferase/mannose-6-phosphate isomerase